jgi:probable HAF family extracellular repeat protein
MRALEAPAGAEALASAINDAGWIVGHLTYPNEEKRACLWQDGRLFDLNDLIPADAACILEHARDINNRAEIIGSARVAQPRHTTGGEDPASQGVGNRQPACVGGTAFLLRPIREAGAEPPPR